MKLIVGLGNPGIEYKNTRHNVGFEIVDLILNQYSFSDWDLDKKFKSYISKQGSIVLAKPTTFMNLSGQAVVSIKNFYKINIEDILVIFDDVDIEVGKIRYKEKGSAGTHNGMRNIISLLGDDNFPRVKIGIKPNHKINDLSSFVLGRFTKTEEDLIYSNKDQIFTHIDSFIKTA